MKNYMTLGFSHAHRIGGKTVDHDCVVVYESEDKESGRAAAFEMTGGKFHGHYVDDEWNEAEMLPYFPKGYVEV